MATAWLSPGICVLAPRKPDYRHVLHPLGETGSPLQREIALGVFAPLVTVLHRSCSDPE